MEEFQHKSECEEHEGLLTLGYFVNGFYLFKGLKHISVTGSAADGPGSSNEPSKHRAVSALDISSRRNTQAFGATSRGNMESLF